MLPGRSDQPSAAPSNENLGPPANDHQSACHFIKKHVPVVRKLGLLSQKGTTDTWEYGQCCEELLALLSWMETTVTMTPKLKIEASVESMLKALFVKSKSVFPEHISTRAQALHGRWTAERWGATDLDLLIQEMDDPYPPLRAASIALRPQHCPSDDHEIWGLRGIMYGAMLRHRDNKRDPIERPDLDNKSYRVIGDNGLRVGQWFPTRLLAYIHGAHGSHQAGISGNQATGAYSIVLANAYVGLDRDEGDTIMYSAAQSHDNTDPNAAVASSPHTMALHTSRKTGAPVRVLRKAGAGGRYAPARGVRYDGLYKVVDTTTEKNSNGGLFELFKLQRLADQVPLDRIVTPTAQQLQAEARIKSAY